ncbi:MAG: ABC transporter permease [Oscillospiraceae bacterium]
MKFNKKTVISLLPKIILLAFLLIIINTRLTESVVTGTFEKGLVFSLLALGIFISFRILDIPDLSVDGTFTLGVVVSVMNAYNGNPVRGILLAIAAGAAAGCVTGILITKLNVQPILAGIITMTALYSINLKIMERPNISLYKKDTIYSMFQDALGENCRMIVSAAVLFAAALLLFLFLKTQLGMSLRATGDNEFMVRASSINSDRMKIIGFAVANALVSLSGAMYAQYSSAGDTNSGTGMLVVGLASIIIGEIFFSRHTILFGILAGIIGAIAYRFVLAFAMSLGMDSNYTKLFSACIVAVAISIPAVKKYILKLWSRIKEGRAAAKEA